MIHDNCFLQTAYKCYGPGVVGVLAVFSFSDSYGSQFSVME